MTFRPLMVLLYLAGLALDALSSDFIQNVALFVSRGSSEERPATRGSKSCMRRSRVLEVPDRPCDCLIDSSLNRAAKTTLPTLKCSLRV